MLEDGTMLGLWTVIQCPTEHLGIKTSADDAKSYVRKKSGVLSIIVHQELNLGHNN